MAVELIIPEAGESITEVRIGPWRKPEGSHFALDEVTVEIETDKAAIELPSPAAGTLVKILKQEGDDAVPGDVIGLIEPGEAPAGQDEPAAASADDAETEAATPPAAAVTEPPARDAQCPTRAGRSRRSSVVRAGHRSWGPGA